MPGVAFRYVLNPDGSMRHHFFTSGRAGLPRGGPRTPPHRRRHAGAAGTGRGGPRAPAGCSATAGRAASPSRSPAPMPTRTGGNAGCIPRAVHSRSLSGHDVWTGYIVDVSTERELQARPGAGGRVAQPDAGLGQPRAARTDAHAVAGPAGAAAAGPERRPATRPADRAGCHPSAGRAAQRRARRRTLAARAPAPAPAHLRPAPAARGPGRRLAFRPPAPRGWTSRCRSARACRASSRWTACDCGRC